MDLLDLEYLIALTECGHFGRAASQLGKSISTISRRIAKLEDQLGVPLFERTRSGTVPTAAGLGIIQKARLALAQIDDMRQFAKAKGSAQHGEIKIATQLSIIPSRLQTWIREWRAEHCDVELRFQESHDREIILALRARQCDVAILFKATVSKRIESLELFVEKLMLASACEGPLAKKRRLTWADIAGQRLLVRSWEGSQAYREIQSALVGPSADFRPHAVSTLALLGLVAMGEGVSIVLESHAALGIPGVAFVPIDEPNAAVSVSLAWSPDIENPVVGNFVAFMRDRAAAESAPQIAAGLLQTPDLSP